MCKPFTLPSTIFDFRAKSFFAFPCLEIYMYWRMCSHFIFSSSILNSGSVWYILFLALLWANIYLQLSIKSITVASFFPGKVLKIRPTRCKARVLDLPDPAKIKVSNGRTFIPSSKIVDAIVTDAFRSLISSRRFFLPLTNEIHV